MYKILIGILIIFTSCSNEATIKNLTKQTKKDDCKIITNYVGDSVTTSENCQIYTKYVGDYMLKNGEICCEQCIVYDEIAEQVLKNPQFSTKCSGGDVLYFLIVILPTILIPLFLLFDTYKNN